MTANHILTSSASSQDLTFVKPGKGPFWASVSCRSDLQTSFAPGIARAMTLPHLHDLTPVTFLPSDQSHSDDLKTADLWLIVPQMSYVLTFFP